MVGVRTSLVAGVRWILPRDGGLMPQSPRAVSMCGRLLPRAKICLVQALVAHTLLERHGHPASLRIGVDATGDRPFRAHAWVESRGRVIVGASGRERCMPLSAGGADRP